MSRSVRSTTKSNGGVRLVKAVRQFTAPVIGEEGVSTTIPRGTVGMVKNSNGDGYDIWFEDGENDIVPVVATPSQVQFI